MLRVYQKFSGKNFHPPKITSTKPLDHSYSLPLTFKTPLKQLPIPINLIHPGYPMKHMAGSKIFTK